MKVLVDRRRKKAHGWNAGVLLVDTWDAEAPGALQLKCGS